MDIQLRTLTGRNVGEGSGINSFARPEPAGIAMWVRNAAVSGQGPARGQCFVFTCPGVPSCLIVTAVLVHYTPVCFSEQQEVYRS